MSTKRHASRSRTPHVFRYGATPIRCLLDLNMTNGIFHRFAPPCTCIPVSRLQGLKFVHTLSLTHRSTGPPPANSPSHPLFHHPTHLPAGNWRLKGYDLVSCSFKAVRRLLNGSSNGRTWLEPVVRREESHLENTCRREGGGGAGDRSEDEDAVLVVYFLFSVVCFNL